MEEEEDDDGEKGRHEEEGSAMEAARVSGFFLFFRLIVKEAQVSPVEVVEESPGLLAGLLLPVDADDGATTGAGSGGLLSGS